MLYILIDKGDRYLTLETNTQNLSEPYNTKRVS